MIQTEACDYQKQGPSTIQMNEEQPQSIENSFNKIHYTAENVIFQNNIFRGRANQEEQPESNTKFINCIQNAAEYVAFQNGISVGRAFYLLSNNQYRIDECQIIPPQIERQILLNQSDKVYLSSNNTQCLFCHKKLNENNKYSLDCQHYYCKETCFQTYVQGCYDNGETLNNMKCPFQKCQEKFDLKDATLFLNQEQFNQLTQQLVSSARQFQQNLVNYEEVEENYCFEEEDLRQNSDNSQNEDSKFIKQNEQLNCQDCHDEYHYPCDCETFKTWRVFVKDSNPKLSYQKLLMTSKFEHDHSQYKKTKQMKEKLLQAYERSIAKFGILRRNQPQHFEWFENAWNLLILAKQTQTFSLPLLFQLQKEKHEFFQYQLEEMSNKFIQFEQLLTKDFQVTLESIKSLPKEFSISVISKTVTLHRYLNNMVSSFKDLSLEKKNSIDNYSTDDEDSQEVPPLCNDCFNTIAVENEFGLCNICYEKQLMQSMSMVMGNP